MSIGQRIKEERERLKLSQPAFGDIGEMGKTTVISWERGTAFPNAAFLEKAAKFGMDVYYVITGERLANTAVTPIEMAYLRNCRALPTQEAKMAGLNGLVALRNAYGVSLDPEDEQRESTPENYPLEAGGLTHAAHSSAVHDKDEQED